MRTTLSAETRRRLDIQGFDRVGDRSRIFAPRVVVRDEHDVRGGRRNGAHLPAFSGIAIPAATEHADDAALTRRDEGAGDRERAHEGIRCVRIIDDDERTPVNDLEPTRNPSERREARADRFGGIAERVSSERRRERVLDMHVPDERKVETSAERIAEV